MCGFLAMIQRCKGRTRSDKLSCRLQLASFVLELAVNSHSSNSVQHCGERFPRGPKFLPKISIGAKRTQPSCLGGEAFGIGNRSAAFHGAVFPPGGGSTREGLDTSLVAVPVPVDASGCHPKSRKLTRPEFYVKSIVLLTLFYVEFY